MDTVTGLIGRDRELSEARAALAKGHHLLVTGRAGIGKSALLRTLCQDLRADRVCLWAAAGNVKHAVFDLARQTHEAVGLALPVERIPKRYRARAQRLGHVSWRTLARNVGRMPAKDLMDLIVASVRGKGVLVFIETLEVPPSQALFYAALIDVAQVAAAMDDLNRRSRIARLLWRFNARLELKPLPLEACRDIAARWLKENPVRFASEAVRAHFLRAVAQDSGGVPAAIRGMLESAAAEAEVTRSQVRGFVHEAGVRYLDMTPTLILGFILAIAARYIARGIGDNELYILSGVAIALFLGVRFFVGRLR